MKRLLSLVITIAILMVGCNVNSAPPQKEGAPISHKNPSISFQVIDKDNKPIENFGFEVYDETKNIIDIIYSDNNGKIQKSYPVGKYFYREVPNQYIYDDTLYSFSLSEGKNVQIQIVKQRSE